MVCVIYIRKIAQHGGKNAIKMKKSMILCHIYTHVHAQKKNYCHIICEDLRLLIRFQSPI